MLKNRTVKSELTNFILTSLYIFVFSFPSPYLLITETNIITESHGRKKRLWRRGCLCLVSLTATQPIFGAQQLYFCVKKLHLHREIVLAPRNYTCAEKLYFCAKELYLRRLHLRIEIIFAPKIFFFLSTSSRKSPCELDRYRAFFGRTKCLTNGDTFEDFNDTQGVIYEFFMKLLHDVSQALLSAEIVDPDIG